MRKPNTSLRWRIEAPSLRHRSGDRAALCSGRGRTARAENEPSRQTGTSQPASPRESPTLDEGAT